MVGPTGNVRWRSWHPFLVSSARVWLSPYWRACWFWYSYREEEEIQFKDTVPWLIRPFKILCEASQKPQGTINIDNEIFLTSCLCTPYGTGKNYRRLGILWLSWVKFLAALLQILFSFSWSFRQQIEDLLWFSTSEFHIQKSQSRREGIKCAPIVNKKQVHFQRMSSKLTVS